MRFKLFDRHKAAENAPPLTHPAWCFNEAAA